MKVIKIRPTKKSIPLLCGHFLFDRSVDLVAAFASLPVLSLNWVWIAALPVWWFYYRLSLSVFLMMLGYTLASIALAWSVELLGMPIAEMAVGLFIVLWIFQFVGHKIEGKKPSFFEDLKFLLIGPVWVFMRHK